MTTRRQSSISILLYLPSELLLLTTPATFDYGRALAEESNETIILDGNGWLCYLQTSQNGKDILNFKLSCKPNQTAIYPFQHPVF